MSQSVIGALRVNLGLDSAQFQSGMRRARGPLQDLQRQLRQLAVVAAAAGAALSLAIRSGLRDVDRLAKGARSIDGTVASLQALELAASDAGVSQSALATSAQRMTREIARAAEEGGRGADALARLGLEASDLAQMDADERVATIADRIRELGLNSGQTMDLLRDLGVRSAEMANLMTQGGGAIRAARREIEDLGLALDENAVRGVERANDAMQRISLAMQGFRNRLAAAVAPALERFAVALTDAMREGGGLRNMMDAITYASRALARGIDVVSDNLSFFIDLLRIVVGVRLVFWIGGVVTALIQLARAIRTTGIVMVAFTSITRAKITALALAAAVVAKLTGQYENLTGWLSSVGSALAGALPDSLRGGLDRLGGAIRGLGADIDGLDRRAADAFTSASAAADLAADSVGQVGARARTATRDIEGLGEVAVGGLTQIGEAAEQVGSFVDTLSSGLANAFASVITGAQSAKDAIAQLARQLAQMLANQAFQMLFGAMFGGFGARGGFNTGFAGGQLPGMYASGTPSARRGLAWVGEEGPELVNFRGGERVFNNRDSQRMAQSAPEVHNHLRNINVLDSSIVGDWLATPQGETLIVNVMRKNGFQGA